VIIVTGGDKLPQFRHAKGMVLAIIAPHIRNKFNQGATAMFTRSITLRRALTFTTALGLVLPALPAAAQDDSGAAAPPARVGEVAAVTGDVSFNGAGSNGQWIAATANYPLTSGDSLFTQTGGEATVGLDSSRITLAGNTEWQVTGLDNNTLSATLSQGEAFLAINYLQPGQSFAIATPRGNVTISQNGNYDIAAGDQNDPTLVTVLSGEATVTDPGATLQVQAGQAGVLSGTSQTVAQLGTAQRDDFMNSVLAEQAPPPPAYAPPVVRQMTGVSELGNYGSWSQDANYGAVWYPQVAPGWAPYHQGHWAYVAPWGYTWIEAEPWGFAPFHYGRWIDVGDRWGWVPCGAYAQGGGYGPSYQPVYAPAVVSFFGLGVAALTIGALASGSIGWVPLAPNEPFYPYYHASPEYLRRVNIVNVRNINVVNIHNTTINNYYGNFANRRAATYLDARDMSRGDNVARYGRPVPEGQLAGARPMNGFNADEGHGPRLPPPNFTHRPAAAPRPTDFEQRRDLPPAVVSHQPPQAPPQAPPHAPPQAMRPGDAMPHPAAGMPQPPRGGFGNNPGFHPPPQPPGGNRMNMPGENNMRPGLPGGQNGMMHPALPPGDHPNAPEAFHPVAPPHPQMPQVYHPQAPQRQDLPPAYRPQAPQHEAMPKVYQPETPPMDRPQAPQQFHPQGQVHPQEPFHPQDIQRPEAPRPDIQRPDMQRPEAPRPEAPRPEAPRPPQGNDQKRPGQP
jgi:hypothetical protein